MKKVLFILSLIALASAAFADLSLTDWVVWDYGASTPTDYMADFISDVSPAGFVFANDPSKIQGNHRPQAQFRSNTVSGWVFDEDEGFSVTIEGLDSRKYAIINREDVDDHIMVRLYYGSGDSTDTFRILWNGDGTYFFDKNLYYNDLNPNPGSEVTRVMLRLDIDGAIFAFADDAAGSAQFAVGKPVPPQTEVPEPGVCAYALTGIAALMGIKRRIRK